jgi:1,4-dihydroxy-2-naphthoyl-CoA hydrolase
MIWFGGRHPEWSSFRTPGYKTMLEHLGIELVGCGDDWLAMKMPVDERTRQIFGRLHGGASVALAETVGSLAAAGCVDPEAFVAVGLEINANHVRPAHGGWVHATARPEALGRSTHVWSIRIVDEDDRLVCISRFTAAIIPKERK